MCEKMCVYVCPPRTYNVEYLNFMTRKNDMGKYLGNLKTQCPLYLIAYEDDCFVFLVFTH